MSARSAHADVPALRDWLRVMVVDDMSTSRGIVAQALEAFGVRNVAHAASGEEALVAMEKSPVHLVISDFNMPAMDGLSFLHHLRSNARLQETRFILITGWDDGSVIARGKASGMNNHLLKPFGLKQLRDCIEAVVGKL